MDYGVLRRGVNTLIEELDGNRDKHKGDHVWNDEFGHYWFPEFGGLANPSITSCTDVLNPDIGDISGALGLSLSYISPGEKTRNYPGPFACYEPGLDSWTYKTLYAYATSETNTTTNAISYAGAYCP
jgi:hypothetical protein